MTSSEPPDSLLDYARFGRQIALREVGPAGQRALAQNPARFEGAAAALAAHLHTRAGGSVCAPGVEPPLRALSADPQHDARPLALGLAAYAAIEHARAVLSLGDSRREAPDALRERLSTRDLLDETAPRHDDTDERE